MITKRHSNSTSNSTLEISELLLNNPLGITIPSRQRRKAARKCPPHLPMLRGFPLLFAVFWTFPVLNAPCNLPTKKTRCSNLAFLLSMQANSQTSFLSFRCLPLSRIRGLGFPPRVKKGKKKVKGKKASKAHARCCLILLLFLHPLDPVPSQRSSETVAKKDQTRRCFHHFLKLGALSIHHGPMPITGCIIILSFPPLIILSIWCIFLRIVLLANLKYLKLDFSSRGLLFGRRGGGVWSTIDTGFFSPIE